MIFESLKIQNFGLFSGKQAPIKFSDGEKNVTIMLAANGGGKSTIVRALRYLFYNEYEDKNDALMGIENCVANKAKHKSGNIAVSIELCFIVFDQKIYLRRGFDANYNKTTNETSVRNEYLHKEIQRPRGNQLDTNSKNVQAWINYIMPKELYRFYFIREEGLSDGLSYGSSISNSLQKSLSKIFKIDDLEVLGKDLDYVLGQFRAEYQHSLPENSLHKKYEEEISRLDMEIKKIEETNERSISFLQTRLDDLKISKGIYRQDELSILQHVDVSMSETLDKHRKEKELKEQELEVERKNFKDRVGRFSNALLLKRDLEDVFKALDEAVGRDELPALDITIQALEKLLSDKRCICKTELSEGNDAYEAIKSLHEKLTNRQKSNNAAGITESVRSTAYRLHPMTNKNIFSQANFHAMAKSSSTAIKAFMGKRGELIGQINDLDEHIHNLENALSSSQSNIEALEEVKKNISNIEIEEGSVSRELGGIERQRDLLVEEQLEYKHKLKGLGSAPKNSSVYKKYIDETEVIIKCLNIYKENISNFVHEKLTDYTVSGHEAMYRTGAKNYSRPSIDKSTLLPQLLNKGMQQAVGGSESQCLALAFMVAMNETREVFHEELVGLGFSPGKVNRQVAVLDSVIGKIDYTFRPKVMKYLANHAPQLVFLFASHMWDDGKYLDKSFWNRINKVYVCDTYTNDTSLKESDEKVNVGKQSVSLLTTDVGLSACYSTVMELKHV